MRLVIGEYPREFCDRQGARRCATSRRRRAEQTRRIDAAACASGRGGDTTALIAVYSDQVFGDVSLYADAERAQRRCALTLLSALDLCSRADGLQRDGPHVREPVDAKVRAALLRSSCPFAVVGGTGPARLAAALASMQRTFDAPKPDAHAARWHWVCERCGEADCERHLLPRA
jgi:hypothetical protein